jgi:2-haloacid dehalogenase
MSKRTIIFDLGGVLIQWDRRHLFRKMFAGRHEEMDYFLNVVCPMSWNHELDEGRSFKEAIEDKITAFPEYAPYIAAYRRRWAEMIIGPFEGTVSILAEIRRAGYQTAVLSNWPPETFPAAQRRFDFLNWFDHVLLSSDHKVAKPDPAIYHILLRHIVQPPQMCLFIDNLLQNINTARQIGFQTIHFQSPEQLRAELIAVGVLERCF